MTAISTSQAGGTGSDAPRGGGGRGTPDLLASVKSPPNALALGVLGAAYVLMFGNWLLTQFRHSAGNGDWSHAYLVPVISIYLLWQNRSAFERAEKRVFWPGLIPMLMGIASYPYFIVGFPNHMGQGLAMILTLFGLVLLHLGPRAMETLFLPIAYLAFGITVSEMVMIRITFALQQLAAQGAYYTLNMLTLDTELAGNVLFVAKGDGTTVPLNVAEACSGMRMLIAFVALGAAMALVTTRLWWKRVVLVTLAVPIALGLNILRVVVLGGLSLVNQNLSAGEAHTFIGTLLLIPGFFVYLGVVLALNKAVSEEDEKAPGTGVGVAA